MNVYVILDSADRELIDVFDTEDAAIAEMRELQPGYTSNGVTLEVVSWHVRGT